MFLEMLFEKHETAFLRHVNCQTAFFLAGKHDPHTHPPRLPPSISVHMDHSSTCSKEGYLLVRKMTAGTGE